MKTVQHDMTSGSPMKMILSFTFPIFIGNVFQQFYNMADAVIVGKFVGTKALAAVGSTGTIMFLIYGFVVGMTAGFTVLTAQKFGAGDMRAMRQTVAGASILSLIVGVILTAAFMILMKPWLMAMNTPADIFADAYAYIMIVSAGILAQMLYNLLASVLRALGNSKVPLYFLILSALLNIVLDLVLIIVFHMGAAGAAVATVVSQGVSGLLCLVYIVKCVPVLRMSRDDWRPSGHLLKTQMRIGIPMALQYSITFRATTWIGVIYSFAAAALVMTVGKYMTYLFVSEDVELIMDSVDLYLKCAGSLFIPLAIVNIYRNGIQGLGYGLLPMMAGVAELVGRGVMSVIAAQQKSYLGVCLASPAAWVLAAALLIGMYFYVIKIDLKKIFPGQKSGNDLS